MELWRLDATDLAQRIRTGEASAREAVEACLARLKAVNPAINAVVRTLDEEALAVAETLDEMPLDMIKDVPKLVGIGTERALFEFQLERFPGESRWGLKSPDFRARHVETVRPSKNPPQVFFRRVRCQRGKSTSICNQ